jgi:DNA-binding transcriptional regulator YiaG
MCSGAFCTRLDNRGNASLLEARLLSSKLCAPSRGAVSQLAKTLRTSGHKALLAVLVASRREAGLSQRELATRLRMAPSIVGKIETGERRLDVVEFTAWAEALKLEPLTMYERYLAWQRAGKRSAKAT